MEKTILITSILPYLENKLPPWIRPLATSLMLSRGSPAVENCIPECDAPAVTFLAIQISWRRPMDIKRWIQYAQEVGFILTAADKRRICAMFEELHKETQQKKAPEQWEIFWKKPYEAFQTIPAAD